MRRNGVNTVSALVGVLLSREFERLGLTDELVLAEAQLAEAQARAAAGATGRAKAKVRRKAKRVRS